jgi:hypothetical protein
MTLEGLERLTNRVLLDALHRDHTLEPDELSVLEVDLVTLAERLVRGDQEAFRRAHEEGLIRVVAPKGPTGRPVLGPGCPAFCRVAEQLARELDYIASTEGPRHQRRMDLLARWPVLGW